MRKVVARFNISCNLIGNLPQSLTGHTVIVIGYFKNLCMTKTLIVIFGLALLTNCNEKVAKFIFDSSKMSTLTRYSYNYNSGKLTSSKETVYMVMLGQVVDTIVTLTNYEYDSKGLLRKELAKTGHNDNPSLHLFDYNANDSLISEMTISSEKDTTSLREYKYFPDGKKMVFRRDLVFHHDARQDFLKQMQNKRFDTTYYKIEYNYVDNLCKSSKEFNKKNNLTKIVEYAYEKGRIQSSTHISLINGMEVTDKVQYFDYSKSELHPDYYSLALNKDTIEYSKNHFFNHSISTKTDVFEYGKVVNRTFFENGKRIGYIGIFKAMNFKTVESYSYFENGDLKETKSYHEEIKNTL